MDVCYLLRQEARSVPAIVVAEIDSNILKRSKQTVRAKNVSSQIILTDKAVALHIALQIGTLCNSVLKRS